MVTLPSACCLFLHTFRQSLLQPLQPLRNNGRPETPTRSPAGSLYYPPPDVNFISSPSNPFVKHCLKLRLSSSHRHSHSATLLVGLTPISEIVRFRAPREEIRFNYKPVECLFVLDGTEFPEELRHSCVRAVRVSSPVMKKLAGMPSVDSTMAAALMRLPTTFRCIEDDAGMPLDCELWFPSPHRVLALDGIQNPGNMGTLLRSAMAFGWDGVYLLPGCCDPFNEKALRAARGVPFQLPIVSGRWDHLETFRKKFQVKMLAGDPDDSIRGKPPIVLSPNFVNSVYDKHVCVVLGSEGKGLSMQVKNACELVSIPMAASTESLNVSVAGGIFLYELQCQ